MIEVEIRGKLNKDEFFRLKEFLEKNGRRVESHEREMYLLTDYPGYHEDPVSRDVDIRLRNTSGECEIMVKLQQSAGNVAREEISLQLKDGDLAQAKKVAKAFGCRRALKMERAKDVYEYDGVSWSLVRAPKDIYFYEAEQEVSSSGEIQEAESSLKTAAARLNLPVLDRAQTQEFIAYLDNTVNEWVDL